MAGLMSQEWAQTGILFSVQISTAGPLDPPGSGKTFVVTDWGGRNYVRGEPGITISRGRSDEFQHFATGSCSFTLMNNNREFDPSNGSSPFAEILKPRRRMSIWCAREGDWASITCLFVGYIEGWPQSWPGKTTGAVEIVAHDLLSVLSQTSISEATAALVLDSAFQGQLDQEFLSGDLPQQLTGQRIRALIQFAGVSSQSLSLQDGLTEVIGLEPTGDILGLCQEAETAEAGFFFVDRNGLVTFLDRHSRFQHTRLETLQATFTDTRYSGLTVDYSTTQMYNDARFVRPAINESDSPHEAIEQDDTSIHTFGRRQIKQTIPVVSDGETLGRAQFWVQRYAEPQRRPSPVTIKPRTNLALLFELVARRDLLDRIQLNRTPLGIAPTDQFVGLIEQLQHRITKSDWECTIAISPIDVDDGQNCLVLNDATKGQLDQEELCY